MLLRNSATVVISCHFKGKKYRCRAKKREQVKTRTAPQKAKEKQIEKKASFKTIHCTSSHFQFRKDLNPEKGKVIAKT